MAENLFEAPRPGFPADLSRAAIMVSPADGRAG